MSDPKHELDALMVAAQAGDEAVYRALLKQLSVILRRYFANRLGSDGAVEDLVQETLIALHERRATYDPTRPLSAWLFAIARYKLVDHLRASGRRATVPAEEAEDVTAADEEAAASARLDVERLLMGLPQRSRDLVRTVKIEGQSVAEAALRTGISPTAVRVLVHRAIRSMAARIGD